MIKEAIEEIRARALELSLVALGTVLLSGLLLAENRLVEYVSTTDPKVIVRSIAVLTAITAYSWAAFFYFKPRLKFDEPTGTWISDRSNLRYCANCKTKDIMSPLKNKQYEWYCPSCDKKFNDPDRPKPRQGYYVPD